MIELLLNPTPLFRKLRQLTLLLSLLLVPLGALGQTTNYDLQIEGIPVTSENADHILGDGNTTVVFTPDASSQATGTLTLNGATLTTPIKIGMSSLTIDIKGTNTITTSTTCIQKMANTNPKLNFESNGTELGILKLTKENGGISEISEADISVSNELSVLLTLNGNNDYTSNLYHFADGATTVAKIVPGYGVSVGRAGRGYTDIYAGNKDDVLGDGKVSFNKDNNTLTLNNASGIPNIKTNLGTLNIDLIGSNSLYLDSDGSIFESSDGSAVTINVGSSSTTKGFLTIGTDGTNPNAYFKDANVTLTPIAPLAILSGDLTANQGTLEIGEIYDITVGGVTVNAKNASNIFPGGANNNKVSFSQNTLSLNNAELTGPILWNSSENLTIALSGTNTIHFGDSATIIRSNNKNAALTFTKSGDTSLSLQHQNNASAPPIISGFTSIDYSTAGLYMSSSVPTTYVTKTYTFAATAELKALVSAIDGNVINAAVITSSPIYQLWVAGTQATNGSISSTRIEQGTVTFTPATATTPNTLTLNGARIWGQIISNVGDLTIQFIGANNVSTYDTETHVITSANNGTLTIKTDATIDNKLYLRESHGVSPISNYIPINGFTSVEYETGLWYNAEFSEILESLHLKYNGNQYKLNGNNANDIIGNGSESVKYSYDTTNGHVVTLNNANIEAIEWESKDNWTIALKGTNSVINTGDTYAVRAVYGNLHIVKAEGATNTELTATTGTTSPVPISTYTLGSGLYKKPIAENSTIITTDPEFVIIEDYIMTDTRTITSTGTITYDTTNKVLTIDGFAKTGPNSSVPPTYIKSGVVGLTVKLKGNSSINYPDNDYIFEAIGTGATILFDGTEGGKLDMQINSTSQPFGGFAEIKYNKLAYWNTTGNNHTIQAPTAPTMAPNANNEVELTKPYADGSIKYSIVYADGTAGVSDATYSTPFAMAAPGTVTAWAEANNTTTSTVKGKYFGYKDAPFTMLANETKTPELIPTIETGDYIDYEPAGTPFTSSDDNIATFTAGANGGVITAKAFGNATLTTTMAYSGQTANVVILNYNNQIKTVVKVAKDITGISFSGNAQYSSYCNTDADDLTLPNGIKAYAVKIPTSGNEVVLSEIGFIPGTVNSQNPIYTPILLKRDDTSKTSFGTVTKYVRESGYTLPSNDLKFTTAGENTNGKECYILYKDAFVKATGTIAQYRCYLEKPSTNTNPARGFVIEGGDDGSTAIDDTLIDNEETTNDDWYDLQGRRIQKPTKAGIYIVNGKKMIVK